MWVYKGKQFRSDDIKDNVAFVYLIEEVETGRKYIGKKSFFSIRTLPPLKGQKRKRKVKSESGWIEYFSSSEKLKALVADRGPEHFKRTILHLVKSKGEASYLEVFEQIKRNVLIDQMYFNDFIGCRIHSRHVANLNGKAF
ncbi:hypothetical protein [Pseudogemmobacter bohemicus]|uniref:hypothetical protein n=1 Tax=Pseudogemmobacter bohemicus TaxID=2250708 RepID=UPI001300A17F|nr:hypothetical protein [Pseudogemmobacter bohemicus]